jgi:flagellar protein FliS
MTSSIHAYRTVSRDTASPRAVVLAVFEAALRELQAAEAALRDGADPAVPLGKAQTLVGGLMAALDFSAGDLATRLLSLYLFVSGRIRETRARGRDAGLGSARRVLETLLEAWREVPAGAVRPDGRAPGETAGLHLRG